MADEPVFPGPNWPSLEEAMALGREELYRLLGEAQRRQANLVRVYGTSLQGRAHYIHWCLTQDRSLIVRALEEIERKRHSSSSCQEESE